MGTNRLSISTIGPSATFYFQADEIELRPGDNTSLCRGYFVVVPSSSSTYYGYHNATISGRIGDTSFSVSGSQADIPSGGATRIFGPFDVVVPHDPDGSKSAYLEFWVNYPNADSTGGTRTGPLPLTKLTLPPGNPSNVKLVRNSDTQMTASWTRNEASNGQATTYVVAQSENGQPWHTVANLPAGSTSVVLSCQPNQVIWISVRAVNAAGDSAVVTSNNIWTTPAAPSSVSAAKQTDNSILIGWKNNAGYVDYQTLIQHGVMTNGTITWDTGTLATTAMGVTSYRHTSPSTSQQHVYRLWAQSTDVSHLNSAQVQSNQIQLLAPPNQPRLSSPPQYTDAAQPLTVSWVHNPVDTTAQTAYELGYSTDGGNTWSTTGKAASTSSNRTFAASAYPAGTGLTIRVRTWGQATTGGPDGTGVSPWSSVATIGFRSAPVATITSPVDGSTLNQATLTVAVGFSQAQGATPVNAVLQLFQGGTLLETLTTTTLPGTRFTTRLADQGTYRVHATVLDSNGLTSVTVASTFAVDYTDPVPASVDVTYVDEQGLAQLDLRIPFPEAGQAEAVAITISRTIDEKTETILDHYPITTGTVTIIDTTPTIHGMNLYTVTTWSADGASTMVTEELETTEGRWAFLSTGSGFQTYVSFWGNLVIGSTPLRDQALVQTAGRPRPLALFGATSTLDVTVAGTLVTGDGSSAEQIEEFLRTAGRTCYRDPSGRRIFGAVKGQIQNRTEPKADISFTISEAD